MPPQPAVFTDPTTRCDNTCFGKKSRRLAQTAEQLDEMAEAGSIQCTEMLAMEGLDRRIQIVHQATPLVRQSSGDEASVAAVARAVVFVCCSRVSAASVAARARP